jgi:inner membrane transporter RhtA
MLALLPATATVNGAIALAQVPITRDLTGVLLVMVGVGMHKPWPDQPTQGPRQPVDLHAAFDRQINCWRV